jgi:hypothetical protein
MNNVIFARKVLEYFEDLVVVLFSMGYFGFLEASKKYVDELVDDILTTLPKRLHKPAPKYFDKYGKDMKYAVFKKNKHTSWYAFFETYMDKGEIYYLVRYIANNHVIAQHL